MQQVDLRIDLIRRPRGDQLAVGKKGDPVSILGHLFRGVAGHQDRHPQLLIELANDGEHLLLAHRIELGGRLVEDQEVRLHRQRRRDSKPLLLAAREFVRVLLLHAVQAHGSQNLWNARQHLLTRHAQVLQRESDLVFDGCGEELRLRVLEHRAHVLGQRADRMVERIQAGHRGLPKKTSTVELGHDPVQRQAQRRLAGTRRPNQAQKLALADLERDVVQNQVRGARIPVRHLVDDNKWLGH